LSEEVGEIHIGGADKRRHLGCHLFHQHDLQPQYVTMTTAVLCCDFQPDILGFLEPDVKTNVVEKAKQMLDTARSKNLFTIFIRVAFRPGYPEINPNNLVNYSKQ
jgi:hypothetical protein